MTTENTNNQTLLDDSYYPYTDSYGYLAGKISARYVNSYNEATVVKAELPNTELQAHHNWKWTGTEWISAPDNRGRTWYNPDDTDQYFAAKLPTDTPPSTWAEWKPGQNRVVKPEELNRKKWIEVRQQRDYLLKESDWTILPDSPLTGQQKAQWTAYRQSLRNLPQTQSDPFNIVWPTKPT